MRKLKISFATLLTLLLVGLFASFASAEEGGYVLPTDPALGNGGEEYIHKTHGNFQNNTNSCGNCHSTHNGDNEALLKFENAEYDLCLSCHDGTMGFYNVKQPSGAGTFGDFEENAHDSVSMHNVQGTATIGAAPGTTNTGNEAELTCSSCHNPHGSQNERLLKTTVNGINLGAPVDLELTEVADLGGVIIYSSNGTAYDSSMSTGSPQQVYSEFCAACHDDYLTKRTAQRADGHYSHTTNSHKSGRNCGSCHYAHGTDITMLKDTAGKTIADYKALWGGDDAAEEKAKNYMRDISEGGSAIKKYTNMTVCWACHQSTHSIDTPSVPGGNYQGKPQR